MEVATPILQAPLEEIQTSPWILLQAQAGQQCKGVSAKPQKRDTVAGIAKQCLTICAKFTCPGAIALLVTGFAPGFGTFVLL